MSISEYIQINRYGIHIFSYSLPELFISPYTTQRTNRNFDMSLLPCFGITINFPQILKISI